MNAIENITKNQLKPGLPDIMPGDTVRVHQRIVEKGKERLQAFEGIVLARKHGKGISATITVRRVVAGVGVEKIFPIHTPTVEKIEIIKRAKVRRAKLYYLRSAKGRKARLKRKDFADTIVWEEPVRPAGGEKEEPVAQDKLKEKKEETPKEEKPEEK